jgi:hypothetical protein
MDARNSVTTGDRPRKKRRLKVSRDGDSYGEGGLPASPIRIIDSTDKTKPPPRAPRQLVPLNNEDVKGLNEGAWLNSSVIYTILLLAKGSGFSVAIVDPLTEDYQRLRERENIANSLIILLPLHSKDH